MDNTTKEIARVVREKSSSPFVMVAAMLMSMGAILSIAGMVANLLSGLETAEKLKEMVYMPYDNEMMTFFNICIKGTGIFSIVSFIFSLIPTLLLIYGIYLIYINAKSSSEMISNKGYKTVAGVMKFYAVINIITLALIAIAVMAAIVMSFVFSSNIEDYFASQGMEFDSAVLIVLAVVLVFVMIFVAIAFAVSIAYYLSLSGSFKFMAGVFEGKRVKKISMFGIILMFLGFFGEISSLFSNLRNMNMDYSQIEEALGSDFAYMISELMPSTVTRFNLFALQSLETLFVCAAGIIAAILLTMTHSQVTRILNQERMGYGNNNLTNGY